VKQRFIAAKDGLSENNRKAKYYSLTALGRKHLTAANSKWERLAQAIARIMRPAGEESQS
jgi:DNA-binding PadR family transcriptional regulator